MLIPSIVRTVRPLFCFILIKALFKYSISVSRKCSSQKPTANLLPILLRPFHHVSFQFNVVVVSLVEELSRSCGFAVFDDDIVVDLACEGEHGIEFDLSLTISNIDRDA